MQTIERDDTQICEVAGDLADLSRWEVSACAEFSPVETATRAMPANAGSQ
jgi:hypothetical protein